MVILVDSTAVAEGEEGLAGSISAVAGIESSSTTTFSLDVEDAAGAVAVIPMVDSWTSTSISSPVTSSSSC